MRYLGVFKGVEGASGIIAAYPAAEPGLPGAGIAGTRPCGFERPWPVLVLGHPRLGLPVQVELTVF